MDIDIKLERSNRHILGASSYKCGPSSLLLIYGSQNVTWKKAIQIGFLVQLLLMALLTHIQLANRRCVIDDHRSPQLREQPPGKEDTPLGP